MVSASPRVPADLPDQLSFDLMVLKSILGPLPEDAPEKAPRKVHRLKAVIRDRLARSFSPREQEWERVRGCLLTFVRNKLGPGHYDNVEDVVHNTYITLRQRFADVRELGELIKISMITAGHKVQEEWCRARRQQTIQQKMAAVEPDSFDESVGEGVENANSELKSRGSFTGHTAQNERPEQLKAVDAKLGDAGNVADTKGDPFEGESEVESRRSREIDKIIEKLHKEGLKGLSPLEREVVGRRLIKCQPPGRIAIEMGKTRNNVDQIWHRAIKKLKKLR